MYLNADPVITRFCTPYLTNLMHHHTHRLHYYIYYPYTLYITCIPPTPSCLHSSVHRYTYSVHRYESSVDNALSLCYLYSKLASPCESDNTNKSCIILSMLLSNLEFVRKSGNLLPLSPDMLLWNLDFLRILVVRECQYSPLSLEFLGEFFTLHSNFHYSPVVIRICSYQRWWWCYQYSPIWEEYP